MKPSPLPLLPLLTCLLPAVQGADAGIGVGAKPIPGAEVVFDGSRHMLDAKWTYWKGPRFSSSLPIKWIIVPDPVDPGTVMMTHDPAAAGGKYGAADIVTKKEYKDFRLHIEFRIAAPGGNSGV
ncbi:MAG: family 16 glycoside hydrolase, partial [Verrucomicrobiota bacterium]